MNEATHSQLRGINQLELSAELPASALGQHASESTVLEPRDVVGRATKRDDRVHFLWFPTRLHPHSLDVEVGRDKLEGLVLLLDAGFETTGF